MEFFQELFFFLAIFRKAKHASNRVGKMQAAISSNSKFDSFFFGMPQFFLMFFRFSLVFFTFPVLLAQTLDISFFTTEMVFRKNTKTGIFKFLTCQKPPTFSSYLSRYRI